MNVAVTRLHVTVTMLKVAVKGTAPSNGTLIVAP